MFVAALDETIVATAIPTITAQLKSSSGYTWIGAAYLLANTASGPIWIKASDIWGRKPILLITVSWFAVASIVCATAQSMTTLIAGRVLQGVAGGTLLQLILITISDLFSTRQRTLLYGLLQATWAVAGGLGPILGGVLTQNASWRWIFWINLPISGFALFLLWAFLDVHNPKTKLIEGVKAIDWWGSLSIIGLTLLLLIGLDFGGTIYPWSSAKVICLLVFGALMSVFFVFSEQKLAKAPLFPLGMLRNRSNAASLSICFVHAFVFISSEYYLPLYFQSVQSATPTLSGVYLLPLTITEALSGALSGVIMHRSGRFYHIILLGSILMILGWGLFTDIKPITSIGKVMAFEIVTGLDVGFLFDAPLLSLQASVEQHDVATATATAGFIRNLAMSISIVVSGTIFENGMSLQAPKLLKAGLPATLISEFEHGQASANVDIIRTIDDHSQRLAIKAAYASSLRLVWISLAAAAGAGFLVSIFIKDSVLSDTHTETKTGLRNQRDRRSNRGRREE